MYLKLFIILLWEAGWVRLLRVAKKKSDLSKSHPSQLQLLSVVLVEGEELVWDHPRAPIAARSPLSLIVKKEFNNEDYYR
jgi:hypothetical protein